MTVWRAKGMAQGQSQKEREDMLAFKRGTGQEPAIPDSWGSGSAIPGTRQATVTVTTVEHEPQHAKAITAALAVMVFDPRIIAFLRENDPKALQQAVIALKEAGVVEYCPACTGELEEPDCVECGGRGFFGGEIE